LAIERDGYVFVLAAFEEHLWRSADWAHQNMSKGRRV
jgi:hypothetical protein